MAPPNKSRFSVADVIAVMRGASAVVACRRVVEDEGGRSTCPRKQSCKKASIGTRIPKPEVEETLLCNPLSSRNQGSVKISSLSANAVSSGGGRPLEI